MKKYLIFIVGFILGIVCTGYATYKLKAEQVSFDNQKTNLNSETVQDGIDELADLLKYGTASASDIKEGKTALVNGKKVIGKGSSKSYLNLSYYVVAYSDSDSATIITSGYDVIELKNISLNIRGEQYVAAGYIYSPNGELLTTVNKDSTINLNVSEYDYVIVKSDYACTASILYTYTKESSNKDLNISQLIGNKFSSVGYGDHYFSIIRCDGIDSVSITNTALNIRGTDKIGPLYVSDAKNMNDPTIINSSESKTIDTSNIDYLILRTENYFLNISYEWIYN